jgi:hypothetical protein
LTIITGGAFLGLQVAGETLAVCGSEISWACEVEWHTGFESTAFVDGLSNTSIAEGSTQAPSALDTLMFTNTGMAVTETVALVMWSILDGIINDDWFRW